MHRCRVPISEGHIHPRNTKNGGGMSQAFFSDPMIVLAFSITRCQGDRSQRLHPTAPNQLDKSSDTSA